MGEPDGEDIAIDGASPAAEPSPKRRTPLALRVFSEPMWVLGLVILMDETDKNIVRGLIHPLQEHFGVGDFAIGLLISLGLLFNGVITVPAGYLADRWNRSRAIGRTVVGWSALTAAGATSVNFPMLVGMRSALGFGQAITEPSAASLVGDYYPVEERGRAFSIQQVMLLAGTGVGVGLGGVLGQAVGWRWALVFCALPGLLVALLVFRLREPKRGTADRLGLVGGEIEMADDDVSLFEDGFWAFLKDMWTGLKADMRTIMDIRTMRYALVGVAALLFTVTAVAVWLPQYYIRHMGVADGAGELWFGALAIVGGVPGVLLGGRVADKYATRIKGARLALPAICLFVGSGLFFCSYGLRTTEHHIVQPPAACARLARGEHISSTDQDTCKGFADTSDGITRYVAQRRPKFTPSVFYPAYALQMVAIFTVAMAIPGLRAGLTDALPAHLRGAGFGAFNLIAVVFGQAAAPFIVSAISSHYGNNLRTAFLLVSPLSFIGAAVLFRARKFIDEDMNKIMMAVLVAMQEERDRLTSQPAPDPTP
ncbi:MAG TPA: MFS transporter [Acidimicrobiales bacterium]